MSEKQEDILAISIGVFMFLAIVVAPALLGLN